MQVKNHIKQWILILINYKTLNSWFMQRRISPTTYKGSGELIWIQV